VEPHLARPLHQLDGIKDPEWVTITSHPHSSRAACWRSILTPFTTMAIRFMLVLC
jgi:hypothetical protein